MGGHAMASGKEDAPGQQKKAEETESDDDLQESEEESTEDSDDSAGTAEAEAAEAEEEEAEEDEEETQQFRSSDDGGSSDTSASKSSGSKSGGSGDKSSSSSATSSSDSNFVESAEDCPNEKNRYGEFTGNGANTSGAYDSTCDGRPSENGNGSGGGRPCMGCVGNADNKNPPGQFPDGSDSNNGYECDGNNGVGKGNPAHTDCQPETTRKPPPPTCPDGRQMPESGLCDKPVTRPPLPDVIKRPTLPPDRVLPRQPFARPPEVPKFKPRQRIQGVLPVTGPSQLLPFVWLALSLIAAGIAALMTARRRRELGARDW
jgi:LPXTG-motif cell wall-anchored protein